MENGPEWLVHYKQIREGVWLNPISHRLVIFGEPKADSEHNCDVMGCSTFYHTLLNFQIPEGVEYQIDGLL